MAVVDRVGDAVCQFVHDTANAFADERVTLAPDAEWQKLAALGTQLWLDTGDIDAAKTNLTSEFTALTTNNTLLNKEVQKGIYDTLVADAAKMLQATAPDLSEADRVLEIAFILNAVHALRLVAIFGVKVSVELHTDLAHDVERSVAYGERYYSLNPEHFIVKVPLTPSGYLAARKLKQAGIPINFTLGFSARHNYVAAILSKPDYCNVFMGRLGAFLADNKLGSGEAIGEKVTLATQRELIALRESGTSATHLIGASMRNGGQVASLAGLDVYTMPPNVAEAYYKEPHATLENHVQDDPEVPIADGVEFKQFNGTSCWGITPVFRQAVESLFENDVDAMTAEDLVQHFTSHSFGDFLPMWSDADIERATSDGKIPNLAYWAPRLATFEIGLDAIMNLAALQSFVTDQTALDDRIRGIIA